MWDGGRTYSAQLLRCGWDPMVYRLRLHGTSRLLPSVSAIKNEGMPEDLLTSSAGELIGFLITKTDNLPLVSLWTTTDQERALSMNGTFGVRSAFDQDGSMMNLAEGPRTLREASSQ